MIPREGLVVPFDVQHEHADGSMHPMDRVHRDAADHDPERAWGHTQLFKCRTCDETVAVTPKDEP